MASSAPHLDAFLAAANYFVGLAEDPPGSNSFTSSKGLEMLSLAGVPGYTGAWCAVLVSACATKAGIDWVLIATNTGVGGVTSNSVDYLDAKWIDGPYHTGCAVTPIPGDLITFVGNPPEEYSSYEHAGHIGIVKCVKGDIVYTIEGNVSNMCAEVPRDIASSDINGYCRPNWEALGDNINEYLAKAGYSTSAGPLYKSRNDRHDMTIRQVGYLKNYALSNSSSSIGISIINYTSFLGDLYEMFGGAGSQYKIIVDSSNLSGNEKVVFDYFSSEGYSASGAAAIVGCLKEYSKIQVSFTKLVGVENGINQYLQGIAAWENKRFEELKSYVGYDRKYTLSGQVDYLTYDLNRSYKELVEIIKQVDLTVVGVDQAVTLFMRDYNEAYNNSASIANAKEYAEKTYNQLVFTKVPMNGNVDEIRDSDGNLLESQKSVNVPAYVNQTGVLYDADFTSYSAHYHIWGRSTVQRELAETWVYQGCPHDKGIAMIGGYYCVAVKPIFGNVGDIIVVILEDNTSFAAIIADEKGEDAASEWGHPKEEYGGAISIIEWERIKTDSDGEVMTDAGLGFTDVDYIGYGDGDIQIPEWFKKKVVTIINYGSYY